VPVNGFSAFILSTAAQKNLKELTVLASALLIVQNSAPTPYTECFKI
jgi:hypothetical protein